MSAGTDSPRWCEKHKSWGDHHTDRCPDPAPVDPVQPAATPEGCVCGHGAHSHGGVIWLERLLGHRTNCIRCDCVEFRRAR